MQFTTALERETNAWDHRHVIGRDPRALSVPEAEAVCAHVWPLCRMPGRPPSVRSIEPQHPDYIQGAWAYVDGPTGVMTLQRPVGTAVILHEMAHQLTDDPMNRLELRALVEPEMHGPVWLSNYLWLLDRLMGPAYNTFALRAAMTPAMRPMELPYHPVIWGEPRVGL